MSTKEQKEIRRLRTALNAVLRMQSMAIHGTDQKTGKTFWEIATEALAPRKVRS